MTVRIAGNGNMMNVRVPHAFLAILTAYREGLMNRYEKLQADGRIPTEVAGKIVKYSPLEAIPVEDSSGEPNEIELFKKAANYFFGSRKQLAGAGTNTTKVIASSEPPKIPSS